MEKEAETDSESEISKIEKTESSEKKRQIIILISVIILIVIIILSILFFIKPKKTLTDEQPDNISTNYSITNGSSCLENWDCTNWTECINGSQERNCTDLNECDTILDKPPTTMACSNNTCKEEFLINEMHQCDGGIVQRKWQNSDCTTEWRDFTYCPVNYKCFINESDSKKICDLYTCEELGAQICGQNKTCEGNSILITKDSEECCLTNCLNITV